MKKKGFTLIELLAVIVILSVITLITVPMITSVIEESKKKTLISSVQGLIESANLYAIENEGVYEFLFDKEHQGSTQNGESLDYKGKIEGEGKLYIDKEGNTSICISNDTYYVYKNYNSEIIIGERSKDNCNIEYDALTNKYVAFLESTGSGSNVYSKDEVDNLVDSLDTKITNLKSNIEELQTNLSNYAYQSELEKTNANMENLSYIVSNNKNNIDILNSNLNDALMTHVREITIDIGANASTVTADLLNTYLKSTDYRLGGFTIVNVNGAYKNVDTLFVNGVASRDGWAAYGYAICISYYSGIQKFRLTSNNWSSVS